MTALLAGMIRTRWAQALTVFLLSAIATAAAVAGPVALRTVDRAIVRHEVGAAGNAERTVSINAAVDPSDERAAGQFNTIATLLRLPGFIAINSGEMLSFSPVPEGTPPTGTPTTQLVFRDDVCDHLTILAGRCLAGALEVMVGANTAERTGLRAGEVVVVQAASFAQGGAIVPDGPPLRVTVAGVYRPTDPTEAYWGGRGYFAVRPDGSVNEVLFVNLKTFDLVGHTNAQSAVDTLAPPETLTAQRLETLPDEISRVKGSVADNPLLGFSFSTEVPALADRVAQSRRLASQLVPVAFLPLVAISFYVIYLAVGHGIAGRREELGMVTLRGVRPLRRWWLATGETTVMVILAAPLGYLLGHLAVRAVAAWRLGGSDGAELSLASLPFAAAALLGSLVVALLGQRRALGEPVVDLLRGVSRSAGQWRAALAEAAVAALAVVAIVQLRGSGSSPSGIGLLVPGLVVVAVALLAARALSPVAGALAGAALRRGRLGTGLAAVQLARRPGTQRLFVLLTVASALLAFVAAGQDVAARARTDRAVLASGASSILTVNPANVRRLLNATRTVDPHGAWAMAAVEVEQTDPLAPRLLALDTSRLATVPIWRAEFGGSPESLARLLRPPAGNPHLFTGTEVSVDVEIRESPAEPPMMVLGLFPLAGGAPIQVALPDLSPGRQTRVERVVGCEDGCRLETISFPDPAVLVLHNIRQVEPPATVVEGTELARPIAWQKVGPIEIRPDGPDREISAYDPSFGGAVAGLAALDVPVPVPGVASGDVDTTTLLARSALDGLDGRSVSVAIEQGRPMLPRLGPAGVLVDLEYLERVALAAPRSGPAEVWLGPAAPADAEQRLRDAGLAVTARRTVGDSQAEFARQGPALALQFHLAAAVFALVLALGGLGLVSAVDRRGRSADLRALRQQGLARRFIGRASMGSYLAVAVLSAVVGLLAAGAAWWAAGDRLPIFTDTAEGLAPSRWPQLEPVLLPWSVSAAAMVVVAMVAARVLRRAAIVPNGRR